MKYKILLSVLVFCAAIFSLASAEDRIVVRTYDGEKTEYSASEIKDVKFSEGQMKILLNEGQTNVYNVSEVEKVQRVEELDLAVDLGLSVKWASINIGAKEPEEYGDYFAWGETQPKSSYTEANSLWYGMSQSELESKGVVDANGILTSEYDAASVIWGEEWHMPTFEEIEELISYCQWTWTSLNKICGYKVTGPNGNSIFIPAAGAMIESEQYYSNELGLYWCSWLYEDQLRLFLYFTKSDLSAMLDYGAMGLTIRPVTK